MLLMADPMSPAPLEQFLMMKQKDFPGLGRDGSVGQLLAVQGYGLEFKCPALRCGCKLL